MQLTNKVAIITGGAGKLGRAYALAMAREGAQVWLTDMVSSGAVVDAVRKEGGQAMEQECDVSDERSVQAMVQAAAKHFGGVDILLNNAAYFMTVRKGPFWEMDVDEFDKAMAINVRGVWLCAKAAFAYLKEREKGKIINISSGVALHGSPNYVHYVASKGAVIAMTRAMARELGEYGICVNAVAPGFVLTQGREVDPAVDRAINQGKCFKRSQVEEDLTGTILFLASSGSDYMTGQTLVVDGGTHFL